MTSNKELMPGNLKRLLEDFAQENDKIKGVLKAHKTQEPNHHQITHSIKDTGNGIREGDVPLIQRWVHVADQTVESIQSVCN